MHFSSLALDDDDDAMAIIFAFSLSTITTTTTRERNLDTYFIEHNNAAALAHTAQQPLTAS
jgi:hypothetical protein